MKMGRYFWNINMVSNCNFMSVIRFCFILNLLLINNIYQSFVESNQKARDDSFQMEAKLSFKKVKSFRKIVINTD